MRASVSFWFERHSLGFRLVLCPNSAPLFVRYGILGCAYLATLACSSRLFSESKNRCVLDVGWGIALLCLACQETFGPWGNPHLGRHSSGCRVLFFAAYIVKRNRFLAPRLKLLTREQLFLSNKAQRRVPQASEPPGLLKWSVSIRKPRECFEGIFSYEVGMSQATGFAVRWSRDGHGPPLTPAAFSFCFP